MAGKAHGRSHKLVTRREFLTAAGAGVAGAAALTLGAPWEVGVAPAQIRGTTLRILQWSHFVPAFDAFFDKYVGDWGKANGVDVRVDHISIDDLPARVASELSAGAGHDIIQMHTQIHTTLYYPHLVDLTDLCTALGRRYGGWLPDAQHIAVVNDRWYGLPDFYIPQPILYRTDLFEKYGLGDLVKGPAPTTWDQMRQAARVGKNEYSKFGSHIAHPAGFAISHCNDANHNWRAVFYAFGVEETDPSGKEIRWDSPALREAMKFSRALWAEGMTEEVFSWDNVSDNRYLDSSVAVYIHDAISAMRSVQKSDPTLYGNIHLGVPGQEPHGPSGRGFNVVDPAMYSIWKFSRNIPAAQAFLEYWGNHVQDAMIGSLGYNMPYLRGWYKKPMPALSDDPKVVALEDWLNVATVWGHPGPTTAAASEVLSTFVVPDMLAQYCHNNDLEGSIKWGMDQIKGIYAKYPK